MDRVSKACRELRTDEIDFALISTHENVAYLSGLCSPLPVAYPTETPLAFPLSMVFVDVGEQSATLIAVDGLRDLAARQSTLARQEFLAPNAELERPHRDMSCLRAVRRLLDRSGAGRTGARVGVEARALPLSIGEGIREASPGLQITDATPALERSRKTKTPEEVAALRSAARIGDAAQAALVRASREHGRNEFEVWTEILQAAYRAAGEIVPAFGELVTGPRTSEVHYPAGPRDRVISRGDTGILDISMRVAGYWCDCCNTVVFGADPGTEQRRYMRAAKECFEAAIDVLRPGIRCSDVSEAINRVYARHGMEPPQYYGHQIGVVVNEHPRVTPSDPTAVEAGMVFCIEPGAYAGPAGLTGARVEKVILVTEGGPEILNRFAWGF